MVVLTLTDFCSDYLNALCLFRSAWQNLNGVFTLSDTETESDTDTDGMEPERSGSLCWYLSLYSINILAYDRSAIVPVHCKLEYLSKRTLIVLSFFQACLSCSYVACGRYILEHAFDHYKQTKVGSNTVSTCIPFLHRRLGTFTLSVRDAWDVGSDITD